jgi:hypothetical protein
MKTLRKRGKPFEPGNRFGKGRSTGSRNKATLLLEQLLDGQGLKILLTVIQSALPCDPIAAQ